MVGQQKFPRALFNKIIWPKDKQMMEFAFALAFID